MALLHINKIFFPVQKVEITLPTIKRIVSEMFLSRLLQNPGRGAGTNYSIDAS